MGANANTFWPHNSSLAQASVIDVSDISRNLISSSRPAVSELYHTLSNLESVGCGLVPSPSLNRYPADSGPSFWFPKFPQPDGESYEFDANRALPINCPISWDLNLGCLPPLPALQPGPSYIDQYYGTLASTPRQTAYSVSGQLLDTYQVALGHLHGIIEEVEEGFNLAMWAPTIPGDAGIAGNHKSKKLKLDEIIELMEFVQPTPYGPQTEALLCFLKSIRKACKRLWETAQEIICILVQPESRFCGLSWSRRFWFLLHGSHPPKTEAWPLTCQVFGCA